MTTHRMKKVLAAVLVSSCALGGTAAVVQAATLDSVLAVSNAKNNAARKSQAKIDKLAEETRDLLTEYKTVMKQVDGLKVYNERLQKQITAQEKRIGSFDQAMADATIIQRQVMPLVIRMIDGLERFVELDVPFHIDERKQRIEFLRGNLDRADVTVSEKFRQVLEAYKIENEFGRKITNYKGSVEIDGVERDVSFLQVGRIALLYQTTDKVHSGAWDQANRAWVPLAAGEYRDAISKGLRISRKQASIDVMNLPIAAPEAQ